MNFKSSSFILFSMLLASSTHSWAGTQWDWLKEKAHTIKRADGQSLGDLSLSDTKIADGIKEALKVGIDKAIALTSKTDGYYGNKEIKITVPEKLQLMDRGLRAVGFGPKMDEFVLSMNRAAEKASPLARDIFINAIVGMSFNDVQGLLKGGDTAATEYFKQKTRPQLAKAYSAVVSQKLNEFDVTRKYNEMVGKYKTLPMTSKFQAPDINDYVINKSLDGLFLVLGQQETQIRQNPSARVSSLLKEVFGRVK